MRALVAGAAGFIGSAIARRLLLEGSDAIGLDSLTNCYPPVPKKANDVVEANLAAGSNVGSWRIGVQRYRRFDGFNNEVLARMAEIVGVETKVDRRAAVAGDVARTGGGAGYIRDQLGWRPAVSLDDGLYVQVTWLRKQIAEK